MTTAARGLATIAALLAILVACMSAASASPGQTPSRSASPIHSTSPATDPSPGPTGIAADEVTSPAQAAAIVFAANPMFAGIAPLQPDLIGQSAWYEASAAADGFGVVVTMGSGDCMAGCIERRTWTYSVSPDGTVDLVSEVGDEVEMPPANGGSGPAVIDVRLIAAPICPVEQGPPDPNCAPRAVGNAEAVLRDPTGAEVARAVSDADGLIGFSVPQGAYYLEPAPVEGLMGRAEAVAISVLGGSTSSLTLVYDTGIR